jgi:glutathione peroxidase-family protein
MSQRHFILILFISLLTIFDNVSAMLENQLEEVCDELVEQGKCASDKELMMKYCEHSCVKWSKGISKVEIERVPESDAIFFDFKANTASGKKLNFERFEGYWTMVVNVALTCSEKLDMEKGLEIFEEIHETWPYIVEVIVFPFRHPRVDYEKSDCNKDMAAMKKEGMKIHRMEEVDMNGNDTHQVYKFLKKPFNIEELDTDLATYFFVNPDGDRIVAHHGASLSHIKRWISQQLQQEL